MNGDWIGSRLTRRAFARGAFAWLGAAAASPLACGRSDYGDAEERELAARIERGRSEAGRGPLGDLVFRGYRGLAELPYFELDARGTLRLALDDLPPVFDIHAHLGIDLLFAPELDLQRRAPRTRHLLDCDGAEGGCELDLDVYMNDNFHEEGHAALMREVRGQLLGGSEAAQTHTIPNLLDEMDAIGVGNAALLPIATGLPFGDDLTERWMAAIDAAGASDRLVPFASVHPGSSGAREQLRRFAEAGARGVKLHPEMQRFYPDDLEAMELYAECEQLGLPIVFHAGRSGIEPEFMRPYAMMHRYEAAAAEFPRLQIVFGHAGARDLEDALPIARRHDNVWLGISSLGASDVARAIDAVGPERLLFGSDWPFYHLATTLAKVLIVTEGRESMRPAILRGNVERMFARAQADAA